MVGKVEKYLLDEIKKDGAVHLTLVDPEKVSPRSVSSIVHDAESCQTTAIMVGGSTVVSTPHLDDVLKAIKKRVKIPVILFPNNITGISRYADAIWYMSLLNSTDPYFLIGAQVLGAPLVKRFNLEPIPLGYIIVGEGGAASVVGRAVPIPTNQEQLAVAHALAAQFLGMRFIYLEAGSGAKNPVPPKMIRAVKNELEIPVIVGGGIKSNRQAKDVVDAGADGIVTGTIVENQDSKDTVRNLVESIRRQGNARKLAKIPS